MSTLERITDQAHWSPTGLLLLRVGYLEASGPLESRSAAYAQNAPLPFLQ